MGRIPSKRCIPTLVGKRFQIMPLVQQFLVSHFHQITCGSILASLKPLRALLEIFLALECHIFHISAFRSDLCHRCHSLFISVIIELGNLVQVSHQLQNASFSSMGVTIPLQLIPRPLVFIWIRNDKRRMSHGIENLTCVGPTSSMSLNDQLTL